LFADDQLDKLRRAVADLSWLLSRSYAEFSALKLVGDRYQLDARQRNAVRRSSCSDQQLADRRQRQREASGGLGDELLIDGFNVLTTVEAALSGGVILEGRDGCFRDIASMHGSFRRVSETRPAIQLVGETLGALNAGGCVWYFDRPVSNSGRIRELVLEIGQQNGWNWASELVGDPDRLLSQAAAVVATSDSLILDNCQKWLCLARIVVESRVKSAWVVGLDRKPEKTEE
jgi:hypothetical protein